MDVQHRRVHGPYGRRGNWSEPLVMIVTKRRDPGATFMTVAMALVWTFLLIRGVQWIFTASAMLAFEVALRMIL